MQFMKIKSMTDDAIKAASDGDRLFVRVKLKEASQITTRPFKLHEPGCTCSRVGFGAFDIDCTRTINDARYLISKGRLFLGVFGK